MQDALVLTIKNTKFHRYTVQMGNDNIHIFIPICRSRERIVQFITKSKIREDGAFFKKLIWSFSLAILFNKTNQNENSF